MLAYLHWLRGWPPVYASMADMTLVDGLVLEHMLHSHAAYLVKLESGDYNAAKREALDSLDALKKILPSLEQNLVGAEAGRV